MLFNSPSKFPIWTDKIQQRQNKAYCWYVTFPQYIGGIITVWAALLLDRRRVRHVWETGMHLWLQSTELKWSAGEGEGRLSNKVWSWRKGTFTKRKVYKESVKWEVWLKKKWIRIVWRGRQRGEERRIRETEWEIHMGLSLPQALFYSQLFLLGALLEIQLDRQSSAAPSWASLPEIKDVRHHKFWNIFEYSCRMLWKK